MGLFSFFGRTEKKTCSSLFVVVVKVFPSPRRLLVGVPYENFDLQRNYIKCFSINRRTLCLKDCTLNMLRLDAQLFVGLFVTKKKFI